MDFYVDTWVRPNDAEIQPGSDRDHIEALIRAKGHKMPAGMMYVRLVHLLDEQKRKELMIIYAEDVAPTGLTVARTGTRGAKHTTGGQRSKRAWSRERKRRSRLRIRPNHDLGKAGRPKQDVNSSPIRHQNSIISAHFGDRKKRKSKAGKGF